MGRAKNAMLEREGEVSSVLERLVEAGAVKLCEVHEYPLDLGDSEAIETVKDELTEELGEEDAETLVSDAMTQTFDECPGCVKNARD